MTEVQPLAERGFYRRKPLVPPDVPENYMEVTEKFKADWEAADHSEPPQSFIYQWNAACKGFKTVHGKYIPETRSFRVNELDLTYSQAIPILQSYLGKTKVSQTAISYISYPCKTCIPMYYGSPATLPAGYCDYSNLEIVRLFDSPGGDYVTLYVGGSGIFSRCRYVRKWLDEIIWFDGNGQNTNANTFSFDTFGWGGLNGPHPFEYFRFRYTNINVDARYYPNIGLDSWEYLVKNRYPLSNPKANPIVVTVHADVYAKLTGDTSNAAAAALSEEELAAWSALLDLAIEQQVTFTTP